MNNEPGHGRKMSLYNLRKNYYSESSLKGQKKNMENLSHDGRSPSRDINPGTSDAKQVC
jgi:hypothetical protein